MNNNNEFKDNHDDNNTSSSSSSSRIEDWESLMDARANRTKMKQQIEVKKVKQKAQHQKKKRSSSKRLAAGQKPQKHREASAAPPPPPTTTTTHVQDNDDSSRNLEGLEFVNTSHHHRGGTIIEAAGRANPRTKEVIRDEVDLESLIDARAEAKIQQQRNEMELLMKQEREKINEMVKGLLLQSSSYSKHSNNNTRAKQQQQQPQIGGQQQQGLAATTTRINNNDTNHSLLFSSGSSEPDETDDYTDTSLFNDDDDDDPDDDDDDPEEVRLKALALLERIGFNHDESETTRNTTDNNDQHPHPYHHHPLSPPQSRQNMVQNQYHHVTYCRQQGNLVVSTSHLSFIGNDGSISTTWSWNSLGKINTNRIMRIQLRQDNKAAALLFQFEKHEDLKAAKLEFRQLIKQQAASFTKKQQQQQQQQQHPYYGNSISLQSAATDATTITSISSFDHHHHHHQQQRPFAAASPPATASSTTRAAEDRIVAGLVKRVRKAMEESIDARAEAMTTLIHSNVETIVRDILQKERKEDQEQYNNNNNIELMPLVPYSKSKQQSTEDFRWYPPEAALDVEEEDQQHLSKLEDEGGKANEEEEDYETFGESIYTLLYLYECRSQSFFYSLIIYGLQMATITFTLVDIQNDDIPQMVPLVVTFTQAMTLFMLVSYMPDLIQAVLKLQDGYAPEVLVEHPGATYATWLTSCLAQLMAGLLVMGGCFVLTMQAGTVIDLMLNLTALLFISEIDDIGFAMAKMGFITDVIQKEALAVVEFKMPKPKGKVHNTYRRILYLLNLCALFSAYGYLKNRQLSGFYLPTYVYVQFGDAYNDKIPYYSGILTSGNVKTPSHRVYWDETKTISLAYCTEEKAWTFSDKDDPCDYFAKSFETETYDVTDIPDSDWQVVDEYDRLVPFDSFSLVSRDCDPITCQGVCGGDDGLCQCPNDRFGMDCEFTNVCKEVQIDKRFEPFPALSIGQLFAPSDAFQLLVDDTTGENVRVSDMPVYYSSKTFPANIIFFGGRRWVLTTEYGMVNVTQAKMEKPGKHFFKEKTVEILQRSDFHAYHQSGALYMPMYISDPVDFETEDFQATPIGLKWWTVRVQITASLKQFLPDAPLDTYLQCNNPPRTCTNKPQGFCIFGYCDKESGICDCDRDYRGDRCDKVRPCFDTRNPCSGNGACDTTGSGLCRCNLPYFGAACEASYKCYEEKGQCHNGGMCDEITGNCICPDDPAITGLACEKHIY